MKKAEDCNKEGMQAVFKIFDVDSAGFISAVEIKHVMINLLGEKLTDAEIQEMLSVADVLQVDGKINYEGKK